MEHMKSEINSSLGYLRKLETNVGRLKRQVHGESEEKDVACSHGKHFGREQWKEHNRRMLRA